MNDQPSVLVVGAGTVGARTTRELLGVGPDGRAAVRSVALAGRRPGRLERLSASFGTSVSMVDVSERPIDFSSADVVVVTRAAGDQLDVARSAVAAGCHVVCTTDDLDEVRALLAFDELARSAGRTVVAGAAMAPGLSCLLARHAASLVDSVEEIHVARAGAGGPSCARQRRRALRGSAIEWRDGEWARRPGFSGRELVWFPDPTGGSDCYRAELADPVLLVDAFPGLVRATSRLAASRVDRVTVPLPMLIGPPVEGAPGAIRVEVRGVRAGERHDVVYGAFDRPSVATAAVAAVVAIEVGGRDSGFEPGAGGLARVRDARPVLRELARRGVRAAVFEGSRDFGVAEDLDHRVD